MKTQQFPHNSFKVFLSIFSGEDKEYVRRSSRRARLMFAAIGMFVILIFTGCFASAYFFCDSLFQGRTMFSLPFGIGWGLLVVNMYLLLLYTVSPTILPHKKNKAGTKNNFFTLSMVCRMGFMSLLAIIIAQPLNVEFFSGSIQASLERHVQEEKAQMIIAANSFIVKDELKALHELDLALKTKADPRTAAMINMYTQDVNNKIKSDSIFVGYSSILLSKLKMLEEKFFLNRKETETQEELLLQLNNLLDNEVESDKQFAGKLSEIHLPKNRLSDEYQQYVARLANAFGLKLQSYSDLNVLLDNTNFYIKRIQLILYENPLSWIVSALICGIFLVPIFLKYKVRDITDYYARKIVMEKQDVEKRYADFKKEYCEILRKNVSDYNFNSLTRLKSQLEKLKSVNKARHRTLYAEIQQEYRDEVFSRYEYWVDHPFRTVPKHKPKLPVKPCVSLMDFLYNDNQEQ